MAYEDLLKDNSTPIDNNNYFLLTITDLNITTLYPLQFRWKYNDGTFGPWSAVKSITTPGESFPNVPSTLTVADNTKGYLEITWDGKDSNGNTLTNFDRVDIYINGSPFNSSKPADSLFAAGTKTIVAPAGTYIVSAYAVSKAGTLSAMSAAVTRTVLTNIPAPESSITPSTPTVSSVLGAIQLSWNGKTSTGADQPYGFNAAKVYIGTSSGFTPSSNNQVDTLKFANGQNTLNIGVGTLVNGVALAYGTDYYVKIATTNGTDTSTAVSATGNPVRIGQVTSGDIVTINADKIATGTLDAGSTITVGSTSGKHIKLAGTGDPLTIYGTGGVAGGAILSFNGTKLSIVGDGTFSGNLSIGSSNSIFKAEPATGIWLGDATYASAPFSVSTNGVIKANSGTIGGWTLGSTYLQGTNFEINSSNSTIYVGPTGGQHIRISASGGIGTYNGGSSTSSFSLSPSGSLSLSGSVTASAGSIGGWTIGSTTLTGGNTTLNSNGTITVNGGSATTTISNTGLITVNSLSSGVAGISLNNGTAYLLTDTLKLNNASIFESTGTAGTPAGSLTFSTSNSSRQIHFFDVNDLSGIVSMNQQLSYPGISTATGSTMVVVSTGRRVGYVSSSRKFKKNITNLETGTYLDKILQLEPVSFDWKDQPEDMPYRINYGLIAEDVSQLSVMESLVNYNEKNEPVSISYDRLTPFLVMAVKEIAARLDALEG